MVKRKLAICDEEDTYRQRFSTYLSNHKPEEMEVYAYSKEEIFLETLEEIPFWIVILGKGFVPLAETVREKGIPVLILTEKENTNAVRDLLQYEKESEADTGIGYTAKYQSMCTILHEIYLLAEGEDGTGQMMETVAGRIEVIGVCSPVRHEMQMLFSFLYAVAAAKERKVLYINLMENSGFRKLYGTAGESDLGDVILSLRKQGLKPESFRKCVYEMNDVSYIQPFYNPENIHEVTLQDLKEILDYLTEHTDYEMLVIDFGGGMENFSQMLDCCRSIYCLTREGYFYQCQTEEFLEYVRTTGKEDLEKKIRMVELPFQAKWIRGGGNLIEQLNWSEFGDYVRRYFSHNYLFPGESQ